MKIAIIALINKVIEAAGAAITAIFLLLPESPFIYVMNLDAEWLKAINWLLPIGGFIAHMELFITAVAIYYVLRIALRWLKAAEG